MVDDNPYLLKSAAQNGDVLGISQIIANDDHPQYMHNWDLGVELTIRAPEEAMKVCRAEFDAQYENGGLRLTVWHPALSGCTASMCAIVNLLYLHDKGGNRREAWASVVIYRAGKKFAKPHGNPMTWATGVCHKKDVVTQFWDRLSQ
jgi:hypothetical protein